jgi:septation ring formation regulator EzrA
MNNIEDCFQQIIEEKNKAQAEAKHWKSEANKWREVAVDQDGRIESMISTLSSKMDKIESEIRKLK